MRDCEQISHQAVGLGFASLGFWVLLQQACWSPAAPAAPVAAHPSRRGASEEAGKGAAGAATACGVLQLIGKSLGWWCCGCQA